MSIHVKIADGSLRRVVTPWVCTAVGVVKACHHVYVDTADGVREAYPLQPDPVTGAVISTVYRNDRIEVDVDWEPGAGGEPAAYYNVQFHIPWITISDHTINAPTSAATFTNNGEGYHTWAGQTVIATITPYSAAGRPGDSRQVQTTIAQLPPPPAPTSYSVNVQSCRAYHNWVHGGGRRVSGVQIHIYAPHLGLAWYSAVPGGYGPAPNVINGIDITPWDANSVGGSDLYCYCRTWGPGGYSDWVSTSGSMPGPVSVSNYRMLNGWMYARLDNAFVGEQVWVQNQDGSWAYTAHVGNGDLYVPGSDGWPRDNSWQRRLMLRPYNPNNGWTGRDQYYGWVRKMANPYYFRCDDAMTWRGGGWRSETGLTWQGASTSGMNESFGFYNYKFNDSLGDHITGYHLNCTRLQLNMYRSANTGQGGAIPARIWLHRAPHPGGDLSFGGGFDIGPFGWNQGGWFDLPAGWGNHLMHVEDGYRGILMYHQNGALNPGLGNVSNEYGTWLDEAWENAGWYCWGVAISHDG